PGAYPPDAHALGSNKQQVNTTICIPRHVKYSRTESNGAIPIKPQFDDHESDSKKGESISSISLYTNPPSRKLDRARASTNSITYHTGTSAVSIPATSSKYHSHTKHQPARKYAKARTLKIPGKPSRPILPPTENQLAVRRANERAAIENPPCPSSTLDDYVSSETNSFYIPPKAPLSSSVFAYMPSFDTDINNTEDKPGAYHTYFNESNLRHMVNYKRKLQTERARRLDKNKTSMSDWLVTIAAGDNSLVAEHVAAKAGPVLRASPILSPMWTPVSPAYSTSSSDSSGPTTPIDNFSLPPPVLEEIRATERSSDLRQRARCSYFRDGYDVVVAPVIPEELLTDEIGVAC
ncbi:unnamed protein product, partial [Rhizoctonia solani]